MKGFKVSLDYFSQLSSDDSQIVKAESDSLFPELYRSFYQA